MNNYRVESNKEQKTENALIASVFLALTLRNQTWYPSALNHLRSIPDCGHGAPSWAATLWVHSCSPMKRQASRQAPSRNWETEISCQQLSFGKMILQAQLDIKALADCTLGWHLDCNFMRPQARTTHQSCSQIPDPRKVWDDKHVFL